MNAQALSMLARDAIEAAVKAATTKELVMLWNSRNVDKPIKKFADRATAEKRIIAMLQEMAEAYQASPEGKKVEEASMEAEQPAVHKARRSVAKEESSDDGDDENVTEEEALAEIRRMREAQATKKTSVGKTSGLTLSAAIAKSWERADVAEKRRTRHGVLVQVNGKSNEFKSVRSAFAELGLPDEKHIRFRMKLKENHTAVFEYEGLSYTFTLVESTEA